MVWTVHIHNSARKGVERLPERAKRMLTILLSDMVRHGPVRGNWPNYSKLAGGRHHCHIKKGTPCYVVVWEVIDNQIRLVEVMYVGTHANAPY